MADRKYSVSIRCPKCGQVRMVQKGTSRLPGFTGWCFVCSRSFAVKHGETKTFLHRLWLGMLNRCRNPNNKNFNRYGGRGITVCDRWLHYENFRDDMGQPPSERHTIERINNDGPYSPENCRWATRAEQSRNRMGIRFLTFNGETHSATEWSAIVNIPAKYIRQRIDHYGWSIERALTEPVHPPHRR